LRSLSLPSFLFSGPSWPQIKRLFPNYEVIGGDATSFSSSPPPSLFFFFEQMNKSDSKNLHGPSFSPYFSFFLLSRTCEIVGRSFPRMKMRGTLSPPLLSLPLSFFFSLFSSATCRLFLRYGMKGTSGKCGLPSLSLFLPSSFLSPSLFLKENGQCKSGFFFFLFFFFF